MMACLKHFLAAAAVFVLAAVAEARTPKPRVPPGLDPGGIAVALIGGGIDYRRPEIIPRLARDGEGELIGRDVSEGDARPFSDADHDGPMGQRLAREAPDMRLVPVRVAAGRHDQVAAALRFVGDTPARIALIVIDPGAPLPLAGLAEASRHFSRMLLVVPARHVADAVSVLSDAERAGLLVVAGAGGSAIADLMVLPSSDVATQGAISASLDEEGAASVAALAARLLRDEPQHSGATLRQRILGLATPRPPGPLSISGISQIEWRK